MERSPGASVAIITSDGPQQFVVAIQRDNFDSIPFSGCWEVPGGTREADESPLQCALRECEEEVGISLDPDEIVFEKKSDGKNPNVFFLAKVAMEKAIQFKLGDEGQRCGLLPLQDFLSLPSNEVVPDHKQNLRECLGKVGVALAQV